jgi:hypothetical protein
MEPRLAYLATTAPVENQYAPLLYIVNGTGEQQTVLTTISINEYHCLTIRVLLAIAECPVHIPFSIPFGNIMAFVKELLTGS